MDNETKQMFELIINKLDNIESRQCRMEARLDKLETRFDEFETRLDKLETRFDEFESGVKAR